MESLPPNSSHSNHSKPYVYTLAILMERYSMWAKEQAGESTSTSIMQDVDTSCSKQTHNLHHSPDLGGRWRDNKKCPRLL
jgi:hypothetical protein